MFSNFSSKFVRFMRWYRKIRQSEAGHRQQYGARALHAGWMRLQTKHTLQM